MTKPRFILHDIEEMHRQTVVTLETGMTLAAVSKQAIHAERAAHLQTSLTMMRLGVGILREGQPCSMFAPIEGPRPAPGA